MAEIRRAEPTAEGTRGTDEEVPSLASLQEQLLAGVLVAPAVVIQQQPFSSFYHS